MSPPRRMMILGTGSALPERELTNDDLSKLVDTSDAWIRERTGIAARRVVDKDKGEAASDLAAAAGLRACAAAGISPQEIDCVICATISADMTLPSCAVFVQRKVGAAPHCPAFDLAAACGGFLYGLAVAEGLLRSGQYRRILLCGVEVLSGYVNWQDRNTCILFGDGAGAAVLGRATDDQHVILSTHIHADGTEAEILWTEYPASAHDPRISAEAMAERKHYPVMNGKKVFKHAVTRMPEALMEGMVANKLTLADIDMVIPHQANLRINQMVAKMIGLPDTKIHNNIQKYGNTTAATIPICMHEAIELGKIKPGDMVALVAFGAGLTWGSVFLRY